MADVTTNAGNSPRVWSTEPSKTLQTRDKLRTFGALNQAKPSKREVKFRQMFHKMADVTTNAGNSPRVWRTEPSKPLQTREKLLTFGAKTPHQTLQTRENAST